MVCFKDETTLDQVRSHASKKLRRKRPSPTNYLQLTEHNARQLRLLLSAGAAPKPSEIAPLLGKILNDTFEVATSLGLDVVGCMNLAEIPLL